MTYDEIKAAWNTQADEFNQWDELGEDEKVEWAAAYAVTKLAPSKHLQPPSENLQPNPEKIFSQP